MLLFTFGRCATAGDGKPSNELTTLTIHSSNADIRLKVEIADTPSSRARGLMHRHELPTDQGMLFIFPRDGKHSFWMKNTFIPLDMVFVDRETQIVGIVHDAEPMTTRTYGIDKPSRYVLELNGGFARAHGLAPGMRITLPPHLD